MKRILIILLMFCLCFTTVFPVTAFAADTETPIGFSDSEPAPGGEDIPAVTDENGGGTQPEDISLPDNIPEDTGEEPPVAEPEDIPDDDAGGNQEDIPGGEFEETPGVTCDTPQISPYSGFIGEDNEYYTRIRLTVTDRQGNPLSGAVYDLYDMNRQFVEYLTTDASGVATSGDVPVYSDYYLEEITPPTGFAPNRERRDIILTEICAPSLVSVSVEYDPIMGKIKVIKTDETQSPLPGAGFYVYRADTWELVDTVVTGADGTATTIDLPYGRYELYEYLVPQGFDGDGGYYMAMIETDGETAEVYVTNYQSRAYVSVYKTGNDGRVIQGAVFSVYTLNGEWAEDITTGGDGRAYSSALPLGDYYLVEKSVPAEYKLDDTPHHFTLSDSWQTVTIDIVNERAGEPGRVKIVKTDESENPLEGVVFGLYRSWEGMKLAELTTGPDGTAESGPLLPDDYYLVELSGKDGYDMVAGQTSFTVGESGTTVIVVVVNPKTRVFGKVRVTKEDDAGNALSGVRFGLYCGKGNLLQEMITGDNGTATSGVLNAGDYYLVELAGLPGYVPDGEQHPFSITENGKAVSVTVTNPRVMGGVRVIKTGRNPSGSEDGEPLPGVVIGIYQDGVQIAALTTGPDGTAESGLLYYGAYELRELSTAEGYELLAVAVPFSILEDGVIIEIPITNPLIYGGVRVLKTDETGAPLSGAVFGLYNGREQLIAELTTAADGTAEISGLVMGGYYMLEHTAPEGFAPTGEAIPFAVTTQGEVIEKTVVNSAGRGILQVNKSGENDEPLPGVAFDICRVSDNERIAGITTDESGVAEIELPLGGYYLMETRTAEGYKLPESGFSFTLTEHGATVKLPVQNQREPAEPDPPTPTTGTIRLIKKAEGTGTLLKDAVFGVYEAGTDIKVAELTTGAGGGPLPDGTATSDGLPAGSYYLLERTAPSGYELNTEKTGVTVVAGETVEVTIYNAAQSTGSGGDTTGHVRLVKQAEGTKERLSGAVFGIYKTSNDVKIAEITTDSDGVAVYELSPGDYYLRELKAPSGFLLNSEKTGFTITAGATKTVTVTNAPEETDTGHVRLIKKDEDTGKRLSGAVFGIYRASNDRKVAEITTGNNGTATYELDAGRYYLLELEAPAGYKLKTDKISFTVKTGETVDVTAYNVSKETDATDAGNLYLVKKAEGTGAKLPGAVFGIYRASDNAKIAEITTDSDGVAVYELSPGDFYLRELKAPTGFLIESARIPFTVKTDKTVRVEVTNMRDQGTGNVKLIKRGPDGEAVSGAVFGICRISDNAKIAEITTGDDGTALYGLAPGSYYLLEKTVPSGYALNTDKHSFTITSGQTVEVRVVNQRASAPAPGSDISGGITIPKTGEPFPYGNYALSALFMAVALLCGVLLYRERGRRRRPA